MPSDTAHLCLMSPAARNTQEDELPWTNGATSLSHTRSIQDRQVVLHLPIVRKNCLRSAVLKQKSMAFGNCPLKVNEFIFNKSVQQGA